MSNYLRAIGTIAPKGRTAYLMRFQYQGSRQYYGAAPEPVLELVQWHRNDWEAHRSGCDDDTLNGSAVGWEFLGFERV